MQFRLHVRTIPLAVASVALACGVGVCVSVVSAVSAILANTVPFANAERLVWLGMASARSPDAGVSLPAIGRWQAHSRVLSGAFAFSERTVRLRAPEGVVAIRVGLVSAGMFRILGVRLQLGHEFAPEDDIVGAAPVAIVSDALWQTRFGRDTSILGRTIELNNIAHRVIGIATSGFAFPSRESAAWAPIVPALAPFATTEGAGVAAAVGRLRDGQAVEQARAELDALEASSNTFQSPVDAAHPVVERLNEHLLRPIRPRIRLVLALALIAVLLALANAATTFTAEATHRSGDFAIRRALGASTGQMVRLIAIDYTLAGGLGWSGGVLIAYNAVRVSNQLAGAGDATSGGVSASAVAFGGLVTLLGILALTSSTYLFMARDGALHGLLGGGARLSASRTAARMRDSLIVVEVALTVVLLVSAGVLARSYEALARTTLGFATENVFVMPLTRPVVVVTPIESRVIRAFTQRLIAELSADRSLAAVALTSDRPADGNGIVSRVAQPGLRPIDVSIGVQCVSPAFFRATGIPLIVGREILETDDDGTERVAVINQSLARRVFGESAPVGRMITLTELALTARIVGISADTRQGGASLPVTPQVYVPLAQLPLAWMTLIVRSRLSETDVHAHVKAGLNRVDPLQPMAPMVALRAVLSDQLDRSRAFAVTLGTSAAIALLLTAFGLFGVVSLLVAQRRREMAIRMCVGGRPGNVMRLVMGRAMKITAIGVVAGLCVTWALSQWLASQLHGVSPADPMVVIASVAGVFLLAVLAAFWPALRAAAGDVSMVMRSE